MILLPKTVIPMTTSEQTPRFVPLPTDFVRAGYGDGTLYAKTSSESGGTVEILCPNKCSFLEIRITKLNGIRSSFLTPDVSDAAARYNDAAVKVFAGQPV